MLVSKWVNVQFIYTKDLHDSIGAWFVSIIHSNVFDALHLFWSMLQTISLPTVMHKRLFLGAVLYPSDNELLLNLQHSVFLFCNLKKLLRNIFKVVMHTHFCAASLVCSRFAQKGEEMHEFAAFHNVAHISPGLQLTSVWVCALNYVQSTTDGTELIKFSRYSSGLFCSCFTEGATFFRRF